MAMARAAATEGSVTAMRSKLSFSGAVPGELAAKGCGSGGSVFALAAVPACLRGLHLAQLPAPRRATATAVSSTVSGGGLLRVDLPTTFIAVALVCALAHLTGLRGAATFLALQRADEMRAAAWASLAPTLPALLLAPLSAAR